MVNESRLTCKCFSPKVLFLMVRLCWLSTTDQVYHGLWFQVAFERDQQVNALVLK